MNRKLPPWMYVRRYKTRGDFQRLLYYVRFIDYSGLEPKRRIFPAGPDFEQAKRYGERLLSLKAQGCDLAEALSPSRAPLPQVLTLGDAIRRFLELKKNKRSLDKDARSAARLRQFFGPGTALNEVNDKIRIEEYKNKRKSERTKFKKPPQNSTINRELAFLRSVLWLHENSLEENPKITLLPEDNTRSRIATEEEFRAIYKHLPKFIKDVVIGYWETPMRESEVLSLRWSWIDFQQDVINLPTEATKTERARQIPLSPLYRKVLLEIKKKKKVIGLTDHVYTVDGQPISRFSVYWYWTKACEAAGVKGLWIHDLRGTWCTTRVRHHDRKFVKAISGHLSDHVFERYVRPTLDDLRAVVASKRSK